MMKEKFCYIFIILHLCLAQGHAEPATITPQAKNKYNLRGFKNGEIIRNENESVEKSRVGIAAIGYGRELNDTLEDAMGEIDIMCLYTPDALCYTNGNTNEPCDITNPELLEVMDEECNLAVNQTNVAFENSQVQARIRLIYSGLTDFKEDKYMCKALEEDSIRNEEKYETVRSLRDDHGADLVTILTTPILNPANDLPQFCGCADQFNKNPSYAYSFVNKLCATNEKYYSFSHEIGHNIGATHNAATHNASYYDSNNRTLMANSCQGCGKRIKYFSSGNQTATGSNNSNNAATINENVDAVAQFRTLMPSSPPSPTPTPNPTPLPNANRNISNNVTTPTERCTFLIGKQKFKQKKKCKEQSYWRLTCPSVCELYP